MLYDEDDDYFIYDSITNKHLVKTDLLRAPQKVKKQYILILLTHTGNSGNYSTYSI